MESNASQPMAADLQSAPLPLTVYLPIWSFCRESNPLDLFIRQGRKYRFASRRMFEGAPDSPSPHSVEVLTGNKANSFLTAIGLEPISLVYLENFKGKLIYLLLMHYS